MYKNQLSVSMFCATFLSVSLHAMETITIDQDLHGQELCNNPKYEDKSSLFWRNFSYHNGFKAIAVVDLANSVVNGGNNQSKDANPFDASGHHAKSHTAYWSRFCTRKWEALSQNNASKPEEVAEFLTLCGKPMILAIQFQKQTEHYQQFLNTISKLSQQ
jgi:hypothetical protein